MLSLQYDQVQTEKNIILMKDLGMTLCYHVVAMTAMFTFWSPNYRVKD